jgi:hypothetical protein
MPNLSPAAQAVKDAVLALYSDEYVHKFVWQHNTPTVAAALRAAAEQIEDLYCESDVESSDGVVFALRQLVLIADELERQ